MIDGGARFGDFAIPYFKKHGGRVICIEPYPPSLKILHEQKNESFEIIEKALWTHNGGTTFHCWPEQTDANSVFQKNKQWPAEIIQVETIMLDDILKDIEWVDVLKLDIEGSEFAVLEQSELIETKVGQIIAELHYSRFNDKKYHSYTFAELNDILGAKNFHTPLAYVNNGFANVHATNKSLVGWNVQ